MVHVKGYLRAVYELIKFPSLCTRRITQVGALFKYSDGPFEFHTFLEFKILVISQTKRIRYLRNCFFFLFTAKTECPDNRQQIFNGSCYLFVSYPQVTWQTAQDICKGVQVRACFVILENSFGKKKCSYCSFLIV